LLRRGQLRTATGGRFEGHATHAGAEELVDITFDLGDRQVEDNRCLRSLLIVDDGADRQNKFGETQITELVRGLQFEVERLALGSGYGKTKARASGGSFGLWKRELQNRKSISRCWPRVKRRRRFFRFSKTLFLEVYSYSQRGARLPLR